MVPICYEESVPSGAGFPCAEFMAIATETFVKQFLSGVFGRTRTNGPSGTINGTMTRNYRRQLEREEMAHTRGELMKNSINGLLPVEAKEASNRMPLGVKDLRLSLELGGDLLGHMPLVVDQIMGGYVEEELEAERQDQIFASLDNFDGQMQASSADEMDIDETGWEWEGGGTEDRENLGSLLDDCLAIAS